MKNILIKNKSILFSVFFILLLVISCYDFEFIKQPETADPNSKFDVPMKISLSPNLDEGGNGYFGICLPIGWTVVDSISYQGSLNGHFVHSKVQSDSLESHYPAPIGYYWWVSVSDTVDIFPHGSVSLTPQIKTDDQIGIFLINYMLADSIMEESYGQGVMQSGLYPISVGLADSVTVTNTDDSGTGSLRQEIKDVSSGGIVLFDLTYPAVILLDSQLVVDRNITITGPDSGELIISGQSSDRIFFINENLKVNMSALSIINGHAAGETAEGGGIFCALSNLSLQNIAVSDNSADHDGGGIYCENSNLELSGVTITSNNTSGRGGGLSFTNYLAEETLKLTNVVIAKNTATEEAGGVLCRGYDAILTNVSIIDNTSEKYGGGLHGWNLTIRNSIIRNNYPGNICTYDGPIKAAYSNIQGRIIGEEIIDTDPLFTDTQDYYLSASSPCIDSGDPDTLFNDMDNLESPGSALWPALGTLRNDMGAYGGHGKSRVITQEMDTDQIDVGFVDFINTDNGWMCGPEWIHKTENGGLNWEIIPMERDVKIVDFVDASNGWLIGDNDKHRDAVYKSVDGGYNWSNKKDFPYGYDYKSLCAVNDKVMYTVSSGYYEVPYGKIIKTVDGGANWIDVTQNNPGNFWSVSFLDNDIGVVSGGIESKGCILRTLDGGATWNNVYQAESTQIYNMHFIDDSIGFFRIEVFSGGRNLVKTIDQFNSYRTLLYDVTSYCAVDKNTIFAVIEFQKFMKSTDGGNTWTSMHLGRGGFENIEFVDSSTGWIFGYNGILKTSDGGESWIDLTSVFTTGFEQDEKDLGKVLLQFELFQNYPNPFNPSTTIVYELSKLSQVNLGIYNILGQKVATLVSKKQPAGTYKFEWDASGFASGSYLYRMSTDRGFVQTKKLILLK